MYWIYKRPQSMNCFSFTVFVIFPTASERPFHSITTEADQRYVKQQAEKVSSLWPIFFSYIRTEV